MSNSSHIDYDWDGPLPENYRVIGIALDLIPDSFFKELQGKGRFPVVPDVVHKTIVKSLKGSFDEKKEPYYSEMKVNFEKIGIENISSFLNTVIDLIEMENIYNKEEFEELCMDFKMNLWELLLVKKF